MEERALNAEIERASRQLRERWDSPDLLARIQTVVAADHSPASGDEARPVFREEDDADYPGGMVLPFRSRWARALAVAASVAFLVALGAMAATIMNRRGERARFEQWVLQEAALRQVEDAERAHMASIDQLEKLVTPRLEQSSSPLAMSYREKLMLLDQAIAECEAEIEGNRMNAQVRRQLLAMYGEKQRTLQRVTQENLDVQ